MRGRRHLALSLLSTSADTSERCPHTHTPTGFVLSRARTEGVPTGMENRDFSWTF